MRIQVNFPYRLLVEKLYFIKKYRINPEIYFNNNELDEIDWKELEGIAGTLKEEGLRITLHAPYMDLSPGSRDKKVKEITRERFFQIMKISEVLKPEIVVFHPGYDRWSFEDKRVWLENSLDIWFSLIQRIPDEGVSLAVENIYEEEPGILLTLLEFIGHERFGFCFDIGHFNIFSQVPLSEWMEKLGRYMIEVHVHDNNKDYDEHLPLGSGSVDFEGFIKLFNKLKIDPVFTVEPHREEDLWESLSGVERYIRLISK